VLTRLPGLSPPQLDELHPQRWQAARPRGGSGRFGQLGSTFPTTISEALS
jgi:hypothetical protein